MRGVRIPKDRVPTSPGEMLREEFLEPLGMTQVGLAERIRVPYVRVNELVNGKRRVTPSTALRLAKAFGTRASRWKFLAVYTYTDAVKPPGEATRREGDDHYA